MKEIRKVRKVKSKQRTGAKIILLTLLGFMLVLSGCAGNNDSSSQDQTIELSLAHFFPATHPAETELIQPWAQAIEEATEGKVRIISYPGQTLLQADAIYSGVVSGVADIGLSCFSYNRGRFPVLEVFELPGITYADSTSASMVAWEGIRDLQPDEVKDTKLMMVFTTGPGDLYTKVPVRNMDDIKGLEIRATGLSAKTLEQLGAIPVAMPQSDAYESLARGVVQGNLGPVEVLQGWRQAEVTSYITKTPFLYNTLFYITMNQEKWDALSPETQEIIETINQEFFTEVARGLWDKQNEEAQQWAQDEYGMEIIQLSAEEAAKWITRVEPIQQEYVNGIDQMGLNGTEILNKVKEMADLYNQR